MPVKCIPESSAALVLFAGAGYMIAAFVPVSTDVTASVQSGPHTIHRVHLNRDEHADYVLLEGEDDYYRSSILLATGPTESHVDSALRLIYEQQVSPYVAIVDPDGDGHPEILASTAFEAAKDCEGLGIVRIPDSALAAAISEYWRIVGSFDERNFKYGGMEQYPFFNLALERSVQILRAEGLELQDVTQEFPGHLHWRRRILGVLADSTVADTARVPGWLPEDQREAIIKAKLQCGVGLRELMDILR